MIITFNLPDLGEGLTESEIVSWHVADGDEVTLNQVLADVETAKAVVELPSPYAGTIRKLHAVEGQTAHVGAPLIDFEVASHDDDPGLPEDTHTEPAPQAHATVENEKLDVLVGSIRLRSGRPARAPRTWQVQPYVRQEQRLNRRRAAPPVRAYAKKRGVDLEHLAETNAPATRADVDAYLAGQRREPDVDVRAHDVRREPIRGLRKHTAAAMMKSYTEVPHATVFLDVDVTETLELVRDLKQSASTGVAPSFLSLVARAVLRACDIVPEANAVFDADAGEIVYHPQVNLGVAMATPKGLVVASIDRAEDLTASQLAEAILDRRDKANAGRLSSAELTSSTITISNVGTFGVDAGVPIINPGESVILAVGAVRKKPWQHRNEIVLREILTLALSFDHRLIDGAEASKFITAIGEVLHTPGRALAG
jgi:2-oxoisovalerate dehydrogenase E2 component (dihydrolipoyl transacylase)